MRVVILHQAHYGQLYFFLSDDAFEIKKTWNSRTYEIIIGYNVSKQCRQYHINQDKGCVHSSLVKPDMEEDGSEIQAKLDSPTGLVEMSNLFPYLSL